MILVGGERGRETQKLKTYLGLSLPIFFIFYLSILIFILIRLYKFKIAKKAKPR
jgi:hypothetical protein